MYTMVQAGSMGIPFVTARGLQGSDILRHRPDLRVIDDPFAPGETVIAARPIRPDVAVFHVSRADRFGNAVVEKERRDDVILARAARRVIVTAEEISGRELRAGDAEEGTFIPGVDVDRVVHAPGGAAPGGCTGRYACDSASILEYIEAARDKGAFTAWLHGFIEKGAAR